ncbi:MAG TPA: LytTR family DNA-binding domain-containing protein [Rhodanobacteraceae bacterium]|nr:LytTR family DNA-binding domain-containing protein [Rhodanobacteraceae bacterium]
MRTLIVDDEEPARMRLAALLAGIDGIELVGEADNGLAALEFAARENPDLVFLDIRMPGMDGLETARHLGSFDPVPALIFCTALDQHALAAFDANASDYLVKPIRIERLQAALAKVRRLTGPLLRKVENDAAPGRRRGHLCARLRGNLILVPIADIDYLVAEDRYVVVHHSNGELLIEESLKALEQEFEQLFVRIHRGCLVARDRLAGLTRAADGRVFARVADRSEALEVSRRNLPAVRKLVRSL